MSYKKCTCGATAEWEWDSECYCEFCLRNEFEVWEQDVPRVCEMCGNTLDRVYYTDGEDNAFCSAKCALEFHGACVEEEQEGDDDE